MQPAGMMAATGCVAGKAVLQGKVAGQHCPSSRTAGAKSNVVTHWKADFPRNDFRNVSLKDLVHVGRVMGERHPFERRRPRTVERTAVQQAPPCGSDPQQHGTCPSEICDLQEDRRNRPDGERSAKAFPDI